MLGKRSGSVGAFALLVCGALGEGCTGSGSVDGGIDAALGGDTLVMDAPSVDAAPAYDGGPIACGTATCGAGSVCYHAWSCGGDTCIPSSTCACTCGAPPATACHGMVSVCPAAAPSAFPGYFSCNVPITSDGQVLCFGS